MASQIARPDADLDTADWHDHGGELWSELDEEPAAEDVIRATPKEPDDG